MLLSRYEVFCFYYFEFNSYNSERKWNKKINKILNRPNNVNDQINKLNTATTRHKAYVKIINTKYKYKATLTLIPLSSCYYVMLRDVHY